MKTEIAVPIPTNTFIKLINFLREVGSNRDPVVVVEDAIYYWMDNAGWKPEDLMPEIYSTESRGYTWKYKDNSLFLCHGTEIRMRYREEYHYAKVEGDEIIYQGKSISPSALANAIAGMNRNAWKYLWIRRPGDKEWFLADEIRRASEDEGEKILAELDEFLETSVEK
ncbi:hypothetical protein [Nitrosomonas communis]|uniref:Uncharacterized protein n=1 Tax=Nitrosomonas communis TaxID=44574 RepID=A0A1I4RPU4_9PROT|nr:hypothetical protein [Nitrosomonas communis]SFM54196.1 hypothetical protein SAMN05421863_103429 [Nitrosomonas communis]